MQLIDEKKILEAYLKFKRLKHSEQRVVILEALLRSHGHVTIEELYRSIKPNHPTIGAATVYRAVKLFCECGLCRELVIDDGISRYEAEQGHEHHDHLICQSCGKLVEIVSPEIEALQEQIAREHGFLLNKHQLNLYGRCKACVSPEHN